MEKGKKLKKFIQRTISGIALLLILFFMLYKGGNLLFFSCLTVSAIGLIELLRTFQLSKTSLAFVSYVSTIVYYIIIYFNKDWILQFIILYLITLLIFYVIKYPKFHIKDLAICFFCVVYVPIMFSFIYLIRNMNLGIFYVWLVFIASWGSDTFAYLFGSIFGKHKITPILSPNKTIEGSLAGFLGAGILGIVYLLILTLGFKIDFGIRKTAVFIVCSIGGIISQFGDLAASGIKRDNHTKDYGNIIPAHGGILDRFDSVIFTAVAVYIAIHFV